MATLINKALFLETLFISQLYVERKKETDSIKDLLSGEQQGFMKQNAMEKETAFSTSVLESEKNQMFQEASR